MDEQKTSPHEAHNAEYRRQTEHQRREERETFNRISAAAGVGVITPYVGREVMGESPRLYPEELTLENIADAMTYHNPDSVQIEHMVEVREALTLAAKVILRRVPRSPTRTLALRHLIDCRQKANEAIVLRGRF